MATQILETNLSARLPQQANTSENTACEIEQEEGSVFRGFFFAMLFNLFLLLTGAAGWEVWRLIR